MKRLEEYTNDELMKLTDKEIETLIDLECAHEGVPLLPEDVPVKPAKPSEDLEPDVTYYEFSTSPEFMTQADAVAAAELIKQFDSPDTEWTYGRGKSFDMFKGVKKRTQVDIVSKKAFTAAHHAKIADAKSKYEMELDAYDKAQREYDSIAKNRRQTSQSVYDRLSEAREHFAKIQRYCTEFKRYLKLAEGSRQIAWNFLKSAHPEEDEFIDSEVRTKLAVDAVVESAHAEEAN